MFLGNTPPHQATIFGPGARLKKKIYSDEFYLTSDLDFFLGLEEEKSKSRNYERVNRLYGRFWY